MMATIRYGKMGFTGKCRTDRSDLRPRDPCIVRTDRGRELATLLTALQPIPDPPPGEALYDVLRKASPEDVHAGSRIDSESRVKAMKYCKEQIQRLHMPMKLVEVDYLFGGERVVFYFKSDSRIDFRELVRVLVRELRTRVELRQVGARDEAKLVGDCGHCGLTLCCRGVLKELGGISMDMAKVQKHTSDPTKITGRCGKLLCCLRYEYTAYAEARELVPPRGTQIQTPKASGRVVEQNLLLREVIIEQEDGKRVVVRVDEISGVKEDRVAGCDGCSTPKGGSPPPDTGVKVAESGPELPSDLAQEEKGGEVVEGDAEPETPPSPPPA